MSAPILTIITSITTFFGLLGLLAYLQFSFRSWKVERSIKDIVEGEPLIRSKQVIDILRAFDGDEARERALKEILKNDGDKAKGILNKVKGNIDVENVQSLASASRSKQFGKSGIFLSSIGVLGLIYSLYVPPEPVYLSEVRQISPVNGAQFNHFPRELALHWEEVEDASGYLLSVEIQDPEVGTWYPHPGGPSEKHIKKTSFNFEFVGSQPGRWRVQAIGENENLGEVSDWSYFEFNDEGLSEPNAIDSSFSSVSCAEPCWDLGPSETLNLIEADDQTVTNLVGVNLSMWTLRAKGLPVRAENGSWFIPLEALEGEYSTSINLLTTDPNAQTLQKGDYLFIYGHIEEASSDALLIYGYYGVGVASGSDICPSWNTGCISNEIDVG